MQKKEIQKIRKQEYKIDSIFPSRWSPRAMTGEKIQKKTLLSLFEAARWAPSAYNSQPWRFIYALRETPAWEKLFNLLVDFNKSWVKNASALVLIISRKTFEYNKKPSPTHSFDTGAAWQNIALQGSLKDLVIHGMSGFDYEKAKKQFKISDEYSVEAMFSVGIKANKETLPKELQDKELISDRKPISEIAFEGEFINK
jgi:nitroreductase